MVQNYNLFKVIYSDFKEDPSLLKKGIKISLGMSIALWLGYFLDGPALGINMTIGALLAGVADAPDHLGKRLLNLLVLSVLVSVLAFLGGFLRAYILGLGLFLCVLFFAAGMLYSLSKTVFVWSNFGIAMLSISMAMSRNFEQSFLFSRNVFLGGLIVIVMAFFIWLYDRLFEPKHAKDIRIEEVYHLWLDRKVWWKKVRAELNFESLFFKGAIRLTILSTSTYFVAHYLEVPEFYWIILAQVVIMRPDQDLTSARAKQRLSGTLIGSLLAVVIFRYVSLVEIKFVWISVLAVFAFGLIMRRYYVAVVFITPLALTLFSITRYGGDEVIFIRILNNLIGVVTALLFNNFFWTEKMDLFPSKK